MIDSLQVEPGGVIRLEGWHAEARIPDGLLPVCRWNGHPVTLSQSYRTWRPDVVREGSEASPFLGFECLYILPDALTGPGRAEITLAIGQEIIYGATAEFSLSLPHYRHLLTTTAVGHREQIYGVGPPPAVILPEIQALAFALPSPVLDFGCGSGALVQALRGRGKEALGLELSSNPFLSSLLPEARPYVRLYDGAPPLPFADGSFRSAIAVEVLEHVPDCGAIVAELARVAADRVVLTVPDMSAIPLGFHQGVVPWHLLEATHINFFTQPALEALLRRHFAQVDFLRIGPTVVNGAKWFCSLIASCRKDAAGKT